MYVPIFSKDAGNSIDTRPVFSNALAPISLRTEFSPNVTVESEVAPLNALAPNNVTVSGIANVVSLELENALDPISLITASPLNVSSLRFTQPANALFPIFSKPASNVTLVSPEFINILLPISTIREDIVTVVSAFVPLNTFSPTISCFPLALNSMDSRLVASSNALSSIAVTLAPITNVFTLRLALNTLAFITSTVSGSSSLSPGNAPVFE